MRWRKVPGLLLLALLAACAGTAGKRPLAEPTPAESAAETNLKLGQAYMQQGQLELALDKLQKAIALDPRSAQAHTVLAVLLERIGRREQAGRHYALAVEHAPEDGSVLNNQGAFLCRSGQYDAADALFQRALQDPFYRTPAAALANAGVCADEAGRAEAAERYFRRALDFDPRDLTALLRLAQIHYGKQDYLRARAFLQRMEGAGGVSPVALDLGARIEERLGDAAAARRYRQRLGTEYPDFVPQDPSGETSSP